MSRTHSGANGIVTLIIVAIAILYFSGRLRTRGRNRQPTIGDPGVQSGPRISVGVALPLEPPGLLEAGPATNAAAVAAQPAAPAAPLPREARRRKSSSSPGPSQRRAAGPLGRSLPSLAVISPGAARPAVPPLAPSPAIAAGVPLAPINAREAILPRHPVARRDR